MNPLRSASLAPDSPLRSVCNLVEPNKVKSTSWNGFAVYDSTKVENKQEYAICRRCFDEWAANPRANASKWEVKVGCNNKLRADRLKKHLKTHHSDQAKQLLIEEIQTIMKEGSNLLDFTNPRLALVRFIAHGNRPLSICEDKCFRDYCEQFAKYYKDTGEFPHCSFDTLRTCLIETGQTCIECFKEIIAEESVAIAADLWSSDAKQTYLGVTAHYIDRDWKLHSVDLCCRLMQRSHGAEDLQRELEEICQEFNILQPSCLVTDNEATNNSLGNNISIPWIGCFAHLVNLIVKTIEDIPSIKNLLSKISSLVEHFNKSNQHVEKLLDLQRWNWTQKRLQNDIKTRWSSLLIKLKRIVELKEEISDLQRRNIISNYLEDLDWRLCEALVFILTSFYETQTIIEGTEYVTISLVAYLSWQLNQIIKQIMVYDLDQDPLIQAVIRECGDAMKLKYEERLGTVDRGFSVVSHKYRIGARKIKVGLSHLHILAAVLDPRMKELAGIPISEHKTVFEILKSSTLRHNWIEKEDEDENDDEDYDYEDDDDDNINDEENEEVVKKSFFDLMDYHKRSNREEGHTSNRHYQDKEQLEKRISQEISMYKKMKPITVDSFVGAENNVSLEWWRENSGQFPCLAKLARYILAIPATSAGPERMFSKAGLIIDDLSTNIKGDAVSALVTIDGTLPIIKAT